MKPAPPVTRLAISPYNTTNYLIVANLAARALVSPSLHEGLVQEATVRVLLRENPGDGGRLYHAHPAFHYLWVLPRTPEDVPQRVIPDVGRVLPQDPLGDLAVILQHFLSDEETHSSLYFLRWRPMVRLSCLVDDLAVEDGHVDLGLLLHPLRLLHGRSFGCLQLEFGAGDIR